MDMGTLRSPAGGVGMIIRDLSPGDRDDVREALVDCAAFSADEVRMALDMVESGLNGDYALPSVEIDGRVRAYACLGKAVLTAGSWYLYWICVHPSYQGRGIGRRLQEHVEEMIRRAGGERVVVETSGRVDYQRTRSFYRQAGFAVSGRIRDFYKPDDDCVIYTKILGGAA